MLPPLPQEMAVFKSRAEHPARQEPPVLAPALVLIHQEFTNILLVAYG